jgi:hypothetical protein
MVLVMSSGKTNANTFRQEKLIMVVSCSTNHAAYLKDVRGMFFPPCLPLFIVIAPFLHIHNSTLSSKLVTTIVSTFTAYYTYLWSSFFPDSPLTPPLPSFDGRAVCYPSIGNLRDYVSWRQVDCEFDIPFTTIRVPFNRDEREGKTRTIKDEDLTR